MKPQLSPLHAHIRTVTNHYEMSKVILTILFIILTINSFSTEREYEYYTYSKLNFSLCYNSSQYDLKLIWYYNGLSSLLNDFIEDKIGKSEIEDKKFEIEIGCEIFGGHPSIELSQNSNGYYVFVHGLPDLQYLTRIVQYFSLPDWESFVIEAKDTDELISKNEDALNTFNKRLDTKVPNANMEFFIDKDIEVFKLNKLRIEYTNDKLQMFIGAKLISLDFKIPCPVELRENYIVNISDTLKVFDASGNVINQIAINQNIEDLETDFKMVAYSKWMNFYQWSKPLISYSIMENKFYRIKNK